MNTRDVVLVIGHSFVKRAQSYILSLKSNILDLYQVKHVFLHGVSGLRIPGLWWQLDMIMELNASLVILDVGSNDLTKNISPSQLATEYVSIITDIVTNYGAHVVVMPQFYRTKNTGIFSVEQYNERVVEFNFTR